MPILVLYSTGKGTTASIAEHISSHIAEKLPPTEVHNIKDFDASQLDRYTAIIIGSAIHGMRWLPEASAFCATHKDVLMEKPLFAFSVGAPAAMPAIVRNRWAKMEAKKMESQVQEALGRKVRSIALFSGKVNREETPGCIRWACGLLGGMQYGELTNWEETETFADRVVMDLKGTFAPAETRDE